MAFTGVIHFQGNGPASTVEVFSEFFTSLFSMAEWGITLQCLVTLAMCDHRNYGLHLHGV